MNHTFFQSIQGILAEERLEAYTQDGANPNLTLARYCLNMALCEALYPALQFSEIALRNAIHGALTARFDTDEWYDEIPTLTEWQERKISEAKESLINAEKSITPGRMVAELNFGFWTGFFNNFHARSGVGHYLAGTVFRCATRSDRDLSKLAARWRDIRNLRNRVFHHERIIHWNDLDQQHDAIFEVISWISPELHELARAFDRFASIRKAGLSPWLNKLRRHWPNPSDLETAASPVSTIEIVPHSFDATKGAETAFGHRWGGDVFTLSSEHILSIQSGETLALYVMNEYVVFLKTDLSEGISTDKGLDHGE